MAERTDFRETAVSLWFFAALFSDNLPCSTGAGAKSDKGNGQTPESVTIKGRTIATLALSVVVLLLRQPF